MNESLTKKLHDLIVKYKIGIKTDMCVKMNSLEDEITTLIDQNQQDNQEKTNE